MKSNEVKIDVYDGGIYLRNVSEEVKTIVLKFLRYKVGSVRWNKRKDWGELKLTKLRGLSVNAFNLMSIDVHKDFKIDFDYFNHYLDDNDIPTMIMPHNAQNHRKVKAFSIHLDKYLQKNNIVSHLKYHKDYRPKLAKNRILDSLHDCWHKSKFVEGDNDIAAINNRYHKENSDINRRDKFNNIIIEGSIKYYRGYDGRVYRGRAYHRLNNMYWLVLNKYDIKYIAAFELFDYNPNITLKRFKNASRQYVLNKLEKEKQHLLTDMKKDVTDLNVIQLTKIKERIEFVSNYFEKMDINKFKIYRDSIEAAGYNYCEFNKNDIEHILNSDPRKIESAELRKLIQLVYPDKMIGSGLFQPILIFSISNGERVDPPVEAYNSIEPLVDNILGAALRIYDISSFNPVWSQVANG